MENKEKVKALFGKVESNIGIIAGLQTKRKNIQLQRKKIEKDFVVLKSGWKKTKKMTNEEVGKYQDELLEILKQCRKSVGIPREKTTLEVLLKFNRQKVLEKA